MKKYTAIHVGTRWATEHTWGVMVEGIGRPGAELLCVGCTQAHADALVARLNGQQQPPRQPVKVAAVAVAALVLLMVSGCAMAPLKGGKAMTSKSTQGIEQTVSQGDNPAAASRQDQETVRTKS